MAASNRLTNAQIIWTHVVPLFDHIYTWAWFVSSGLSAVAYYALMRGRTR